MTLTTATQHLPLAAAMLGASAFGGLISGLLGVGGGIVVVPALEVALAWLKVDKSITMNIAVATSMAAIIPTSISSMRAHLRRESVDIAVARRWAVPAAVGALAGSVAASHVDGRVLASVFAVVAGSIALRMLLARNSTSDGLKLPAHGSDLLMPIGIGGVSALMGIGGGTLSVPVMTYFGQPIHRAVGTAACLGACISIPATAGFLAANPAGAMPPGSIGYVSVLGLVVIAPVSWMLAPLGARIAHSLDRPQLSRAFGIFLALVAVRMCYKSLA